MIFNLQESSYLILIGLLLGVAYFSYFHHPAQDCSKNPITLANKVTDFVQEKTAQSLFARIIVFSYVTCFWVGIIFYLINYMDMSKKMLFAYFAE